MRYLHFVLSKAGVVESIFSHFRKLDFKENETSHEADLDLGIFLVMFSHSVFNYFILINYYSGSEN